MAKNKKLLVLERSTTRLDRPNSSEYILEGVFTELGVVNNNGRIYEEREVIPHIEKLQKKIEKAALLGELDHPKEFETTYTRASHVIESLRYDADKKQIIGRIRILNTRNGKEAQALLDDGIPLFVSSRSAGIVESNGKVKLKEMYTYDLVPDPGFSNARLGRVNESYGFDPDGPVEIYEIDESQKESTDDMEYLTVEHFNRYTEFVKTSSQESFAKIRSEIEELKKLKGTAVSEGASTVSIADSPEFKQLLEKVEALEEANRNLIVFADEIVENLEKVTDYTETLSKVINENSSELNENHEKLVEYVGIIRESVNSAEKYVNVIVEEVNRRERYQDEVNEHVDALISHSDLLSESVDALANFGNHLREHMVGLGETVEAITEGRSTKDSGKLDEGKEGETAETTETTETETNAAKVDEAAADKEKKDVIESLDEGLIAALTQGAGERQAPTKEPFYQFLTKDRRQEFDEMSDEKREKIVEAFKRSKYFGSADVSRIWESAMVERPAPLNWLHDAPEKYKKIYESLSSEKKTAIKAQASMRVLDTEYKIANFWETRDLRTGGPAPLNEGKVTPINEESTEYRTDSAWMEAVKEGLQKRFKR